MLSNRTNIAKLVILEPNILSNITQLLTRSYKDRIVF